MSRRSFTMTTRLFVLLIASIAIVSAESAASDREDAEQLVAEALHREIYGLQADRDRLLAKATVVDPNYAPARWHQGFVRVGDGWSHVYDAQAVIGTSPELSSYRRLRAEIEDSADGHLELARWCGDRRMLDQQRAHLSRVLDFDPNNADVREQLGFRLVNGQWVEPAEIARQREQRASRQLALEQWREQMLDLRRDLSHAKLDTRNAAAARIRAITAANAIPAFEEILSPHSQVAAKLVLEAIAQMPEQVAVESLIRHAVFAPWPEVRDEASLLLKEPAA